MKSKEQMIDDLVTYMSLAQIKGGGIFGPKVNGKKLDGAVFLLGNVARDELMFYAPGSVELSHLTRPLNIGTIVDSGDRDGIASFCVSRQVPPREVRGFAKKIMPVMVEHIVAHLSDDGTLLGAWNLLGCSASKGKWIDITNAPLPNKWVEGSANQMLSVQMAVQLTMEEIWTVYVAFDGCPGVRFATTPEGSREVFRLRDIPEGRQRRAALKNWISEHTRHLGEFREKTTTVREHLRGAEEFHWNGMTCRIEPSRSDLERNKELADARKRDDSGRVLTV